MSRKTSKPKLRKEDSAKRTKSSVAYGKGLRDGLLRTDSVDEEAGWERRFFAVGGGREWLNQQALRLKSTRYLPNQLENIDFGMLSTRPPHRATRSLPGKSCRSDRAPRKRNRSFNEPMLCNEGDFYFTSSTAKRLEAFRMNEEMWYRHLTHLADKSVSSRNKTFFWRIQLRGLQKKDFKPISRIAEGSFMKVFAVVQKKRRPDVPGALAMKILERIELQEEEIIKEFEIMLKLSGSEYFPTFYGFFFDHSHYQMCYLMEFLNGVCMMTLTYAILHPPREQHPEFMAIAEYYTAEMVRALAYLHHLINVPHGDLKNDNIMICMNGRLKLFDFDYCGQHSLYHHSERYHRYDPRKYQAVRRYFKKEIRAQYPACLPKASTFVDIFRVDNLTKVKEQERRLKVRALSGHRAYRSPEYHAMDKKGDLISRKRAMMSDWWSVGVLAYELFMGIHPFSKKDPGQTYPRFRCMNTNDVIKHENYAPLSQSFIASRCGEKVATLLRCMLTSEEQRLGRASMASDLCGKAIELGFKYFGNEIYDPPFRPRVVTVEEMAENDPASVNHAAKSFNVPCKANKSYVGFPFLTYAAF